MNAQGALLGGVNGAFGGAASGLAMSNPYSAAAMAAGQVLTSTLGGPDPNQTSANAPFNPFTVDNSGWSVNFGSGTSNAAPNPVSTLAQGLANAAHNLTGGGGGGSDPLMMIMLAVVAVLAIKHGK
jgi:hypothetical protein